MTRVTSTGPAGAPAGRRTAVAARKRRPHKIILESITEERKKLQTAISFKAKAPVGFRFIPAGNPRLTQKCKELSHADGKQVIIVSTSHQAASNIAQHINRIGYHFADVVVKRACQALGVRLDRAGRVTAVRGRGANGTDGRPQGPTREADLSSQERLNAQATDALIDLFPKIPERDRNRIISRAFKQGKHKVGTAEELPLARRVHLAVAAHIRHVHTDYDQLLRDGVSQKEARARIEDACLRKIVEWSGNDENGRGGSDDMKEIIREVIIISDDEDDDHDDLSDDGDRAENGPVDLDSDSGSDSDVEFISSHPVPQRLGIHSSPNEDTPGTSDTMNHRRQPQIDTTQPTQPLRGSERLQTNRRDLCRHDAISQLQEAAFSSGPPPLTQVPPVGTEWGRTSALATPCSPGFERTPAGESHQSPAFARHGYRESSLISPTASVFPQPDARAFRGHFAADASGSASREPSYHLIRPVPRPGPLTDDLGIPPRDPPAYPPSGWRRPILVSNHRRSSDSRVPQRLYQALSRPQEPGPPTPTPGPASPRVMRPPPSTTPDPSTLVHRSHLTTSPSVEGRPGFLSRSASFRDPGPIQPMIYPGENYDRHPALQESERRELAGDGLRYPGFRGHPTPEVSHRPHRTVMVPTGPFDSVVSHRGGSPLQACFFVSEERPAERELLWTVPDRARPSRPHQFIAVESPPRHPFPRTPVSDVGTSRGASYRHGSMPGRALAVDAPRGPPVGTPPPLLVTGRRNDFLPFRNSVPRPISLAPPQGTVSHLHPPAPSPWGDGGPPRSSSSFAEPGDQFYRQVAEWTAPYGVPLDDPRVRGT